VSDLEVFVHKGVLKATVSKPAGGDKTGWNAEWAGSG